MIDAPVRLALLGASSLFIVALACGVWKFVSMSKSPTATAPAYVDIAHRAALMYAFAAHLAAALVAFNDLPRSLMGYAIAVLLASFYMAIFSYILHGYLGDTDNQYRRPHALGSLRLPKHFLPGLTWMKAVGEIGASALLFYGCVSYMFTHGGIW
jgi:hypothetical protein